MAKMVVFLGSYGENHKMF